MVTSCPQSFHQYSLDVSLRPFATFKTFIYSEKNELLTELRAISKDSGEPRQYFIWGSAVTGKSHLLQSVCNYVSNTNNKAVYLPLKQLAKYGCKIFSDIHHLDTVCIDDVDQVLGDKAWDHALFMLINELRTANKSLLLTASVNPNHTKASLLDLASRLSWGPVYKLNHLTDKQKELAVQAHADARGFKISSEVSNYLLKQYPRDLNKLIELVDRIDKHSLNQKRKVTLGFVKSILENEN